MIRVEQLARMLAALGEEFAGFEVAHVQARAETLETPAQVEDRITHWIARWRADQGWIARQSAVAELGQDNPAKGHIIAAELAGNGRSLHIRQSEQGYVAAHYWENGDGEACLAETLRHVHAQNPQRAILYRRYWRLDPDGVPRAAYARFMGFETMGGGS